jgi:hypothetical protein
VLALLELVPVPCSRRRLHHSRQPAMLPPAAHQLTRFPFRAAWTAGLPPSSRGSIACLRGSRGSSPCSGRIPGLHAARDVAVGEYVIVWRYGALDTSGVALEVTDGESCGRPGHAVRTHTTSQRRGSFRLRLVPATGIRLRPRPLGCGIWATWQTTGSSTPIDGDWETLAAAFELFPSRAPRRRSAELEAAGLPGGRA